MSVSGDFRGRIWGILMAAYGEFFVAVDISGSGAIAVLSGTALH